MWNLWKSNHTPLVFQTNVRTSYTKVPIVGVDGFEPPTHAGYQIYSLALNQFSLTPNFQFCYHLFLPKRVACSGLVTVSRKYRIRTYDPLDVNQML